MKAKFYIMDISRIGPRGLYCDGAETVCNGALRYEDFVRSAAGRQLLKYALWREFKMALNYESLMQERRGKLILSDCPIVSFNISHSNQMVACAVGKRPLGIDVEYKKQIEYRPLADHFFHKNELEYINKVDPGAGLDQFYKLWTLKESYIKCTGDGLSKELDSFIMTADSAGRMKVYDKNNPERSGKYRFYHTRCNSQYHVSICSEQSDICKEGKMLNYSEVAGFLNNRIG
ncbi:4'-phosphopantetheinyl transferase superfamily protein [Enterocloster clostridioformis]